MNTIIVVMEGGVIQDISGIPSDLEIEVRDYDVEGADSVCDNIQTDGQGDEYASYLWRN